MNDDTVILYTTDSIEDQTPNTYQYSLDISGEECLKLAMENMGMVPLPGYNLLHRTNHKNVWIDLQVSLRAQGVQTGDMIIVLPSFFELPNDSSTNLNSSGSSPFDSTFESDSTFYNPTTFDSNSFNDSHLVPSPMSESLLIQPSQLDTDSIDNPSPLIDNTYNMDEAYQPIPAPQLPTSYEPIKIEAINMDEIGSMSDDDEEHNTNNNMNNNTINSEIINDTISSGFGSSLNSNDIGVNSNMVGSMNSTNNFSGISSTMEPTSILMNSSGTLSRDPNRSVKFQSLSSTSDVENGDVDLFIGDEALDLQTNRFDTFHNFEKVEVPKQKSKESQTIALATYDGFHKGGTVFSYDFSSSFEEILSNALKNLGHEREGRYTILIKTANEKKIFKEDQFLDEFLLQNQDSIHLFKCEHKVKIDSNSFVPEVINLDLSKCVDDLCADIAKHFDFSGYLTYNLFTVEEEIPRPLDGKLTVLEQTEHIRRFTFQKQYYIFSGEDLFTLESAKIAAYDAMRQLPKDDVILTEDEAARVLILYAIADKEMNKVVDYYKFSNKGNTHLPDCCKDMKLVPKIKKLIPQYKKSYTTFTAIRELLHFLRHKQGFGSYSFDNCKVEIKYKGKKMRYHLIVQVAPYCIRFIRPVSKLLEDRISYSKIFSNELLGERLQIQFTTRKNEVAKYTIIGPDSEKIKFYMEQHMLIIRKIQHQRAKERASKFGGAVIDQIDNHDRVDLITHLSFNDKAPKKIPYDLKMDGKIALQHAEQSLGIPHSDDNVFIIRIYKEMFQWAKAGQMIRMLKVQNDMNCYILKNNRPIRFHFSDGHTTKIIIDITKPIEELIDVVFHNLKIQPMLGYTFYSLEDPKNPVPLDSRFTIPEVCRDWTDLLFKRRFFVISGEVLSNAFSTRSTFADCREQFLKGGCTVTDDQVIELAILARYAVADDATTVKNAKILDWTQEAPQDFKVTKKFQTKYYDSLKKSKPMDQFTAARSYLGKVRKLKEFGTEKFSALYTDLTPPVVKDKKDTKREAKVQEEVTLIVGPLFVVVYSQSPKGEITLLKDLSYRLIVTIESLGHRIVIRHINNDDTTSAFELKLKNANVALMMINYNIKIIHDLMLAKQRKRKAEAEENAKRLAGGFIDENGIVRSRMNDFYVSKDLTKTDKLPKVWLELEKNGKEVVDILTPLMKLNTQIEWVILMRLVRKEWKWILEDKTLESAEPERLSTIFVLEAYPMIEVKFSMGMTKTMKLPIFKKVSELVKIIAGKLNLSSSIGFTLYLLKGKEEIPLDGNITLPEQTPIYDHLFFKRRFFIISKFDMEDDDSLYQLFCDVRALVHEGKIEMSSETALKLMYYELKVDYPIQLTKESIPKDHEKYLPIGMKPKEKVQKFIKKMIDEFPVKDRRAAMIEYIRIARTLPTFGSEKYELTLVEEKKDTVERSKVFLIAGPYKVFIKDESQKKILFTISTYKLLLGVNSTDQEFCIRYHNNEDIRKIEKIHLESENSQKIAGFLMSYLQTLSEILLKRIETNDDTQPTDRIELKTVYGYDIEHFVKCTYDVRWKGEVVIQSACRGLGLDPEGQYSCLLRKSDEDFEWVEKDTVFGTLNPTFALYVHIYHEFMPVQVTAPVTGYERLMYLKVTRKVKKLVEEVAFKMFIDNPTGFTLYYENFGKFIPLDLMDPIPYQCIDFSKLYFKRRFLTFTKEDVRNPFTSVMIYPDVKERFVSEKCNASTNRMVELVGYQLIAESNDDQEVQSIKIPDDLTPYLAYNYIPKPDFRDKLRTALNARASAQTDKIKAGAAFIVSSAKMNSFGCEYYDCYDFRKEGSFISNKPRKRFLKISIGPNSITIYDPQTQKDIIYAPHKSIVSCHLIKNNVIMQVASKTGTKEASLARIVIASDHAAKISSIILNYRHVVIPSIDKRDSIQKLPSINPQFQALIDPKFLASETVDVKISRQLEHPKPPIYQLSKKYNVKEAISVGLYRINYPNKGDFMILESKERKRYDNDYNWLSVEDEFVDADPTDNSNVFIMLQKPYCQVIGENMHIKENYVDMKTIIFDLCTKLVDEFGFGNNLGYTLYEFWEGKQRPLDFLFNIPTNMENYIEVVLRRRFFLFTKEILSDEATLRASFKAVKNQVLSGTMTISDDTAAELAIYALYYSAQSSNDVLPFISTANEQTINNLLPSNIKVSPNIVKKFTALGSIIQPLQPLEAAMKYIVLANSCTGFGMEEYPCIYSEVNNFAMTNVVALVRLCPYYVSIVYDNKEQTEITRFGWNNIVEYKREDILTKIKYQNESSLFVSIELKSDKDCREIFSFINDIMDLFARADFSHLGQLQDAKLDVEFNFDDMDLDMNGVDQFNFDDLNAIHVYQNDQEFEFGTSATDDTIYLLEELSKLGKVDENNWQWRALDDGLVTVRASTLLDNITNGLDLDDISKIKMDDLTYRINLLNDDLKRFDFDDETKTHFLDISSCLESLRDSSLTAEDEQGESRLTLLLNSINTCRIFLDDKIYTIKSQAEEPDIDNITSPSTIVSYNLLGVSQMMEDILNQLNLIQHEQPDEIKLEINNILLNIITQSTTITRISGIILKNQDPSILPQLINPILSDMKLGNADLNNLIVTIKSNGGDVTNLNNLIDDLNKLMQSLENNPAIQQVNQHKTTKYVMMLGDLRDMPVLVKSLEETNEELNDLNNLENIDLDPSLITNLNLLHNNINLNIPYLNDKIVAVQSNPLNDIARSDMLRSLYDLQDAINIIIPQLESPENKEKKFVIKVTKTMYRTKYRILDNILRASTINITPNNIQAIEIDLNNLINRYGGLEYELKEKIHDTDTEKVENALKTLRDSRFLISGLLTQLQNTPASGEIIAKLQKVICDLNNQILVVKSFGDIVKDIGKDMTYPVIIESLEANIKNALTELPPTEDINQCLHVARFRQLQIDTGKLLNQVKAILDSPNVRADQELIERLTGIYTKTITNYNTQIEIRRMIQAYPYDNVTIDRAIDVVEELENLTTKFNAANGSIQDPSMNILLSNLVNTLFNDIELSKNILRVAPLDVFNEPPSEDLIHELDQLLNGITNYLVPEIDQALSRGYMEQQYLELQSKVNTILPVIPNYLQAGRDQSNEFFTMTPSMKNLVNDVKSGTDPISNLSSVNPYIDRLNIIFDKIMLGSDASYEISFDLLQNLIDKLAEFSDLVTKLSLKPEISDEAKLLLNDFAMKSANLKTNLIVIVKSRDPDSLVHAKDLILQFRSSLSQIPTPIRSSLSSEDFTNLISIISTLTMRSNYVVSCIRHLPTQKKLLIDSSFFKKITKDDEIEDSTPVVKVQCEIMRDHIDKLLNYQPLKDKKATLEMLERMKQTFSPIDDFDDDIDEKYLLKLLIQLTDSKIFMKESSILVAPVVDDPNLVSCERIRSDNVTILMRVIQAPHLTNETSEKMLEELPPQLDIVYPLLNEFKEREDVVSLKEFKDLLDSYYLLISTSKSSLLTSRKVEQQKIIDDLYRETSTVLPVLMDNPDYSDFQTEITVLFEILSKYTSLPLQNIRFTTPLQVKKEIYSSLNNKDLLVKTIDQIGSNTTLLSPDLCDGLSNLMNSLNSSPESIPRYLYHVSHILFTTLSTRNLLYAPIAVRAAISGFTDRNDMFELLEMLIIQTARRASMQLNLVQQPFNEIEVEFAEKKESFNEQQQYWLAHSSKSLKSIDTTLLIQCPSIPTFVFDYVPMHKIQQNLVLLSDSFNKSNLHSAVKNYGDWLFQCDMAAVAFFMAHMDQIATSCDDLLSDGHEKAPESLKDFIRKSANILKEIDRCVFYNTPSLSQLARLYIDFSGKLYEELRTIYASDKTVLITSSVNSLTRIKQVIFYWANHYDNFDDFHYTKSILSCAHPIITRTAEIQASGVISDSEDAVALDIAPANADLTTINATIQSGIKNNILKADKLQKTTEKANSIAFDIIARPPYRNIVISRELIRYGKNVSAILEKLNKHHKVDWSRLPSDTTYQRREEDLDTIDDPKMKEYLKEIREYLKKLKEMQFAGMLRSSLTAKVLARSEISERKYPGLIDPILLINDGDTRGILSIDTLLEKDKFIELKDKNKLDLSSSQTMEDLSFRKLQNIFITQRLTSLKHQQILEFPIVLSRLESIEKEERVRIGKEEITASFDFIVKQLDKLNERSDLKELQKNYIPDQILIQQIILTKMIRDQQVNPASPVKFIKRINKGMETLLLSAIEQLKTSIPKPRTFKEINAMMNRGFSHITLINQLIQVLQFIIIVDPDIMKFAQSPEGQEALSSPLPIEQIGKEQSLIAHDIQLVSKPDLLYTSFQSYMQPNIIIKLRVITSLINILISEEAEDFMTQNNIVPTVADLLDFAIAQQNLIVQSRTDQDNTLTLIDTQLITRAQQTILNLTLRVSLLYRLLTAKDAQILINPKGPEALQNSKKKLTLSNEEIELHTDSIISQVLCSTINVDEIKGIEINDLTSQQLMLIQLCTLIASGTVNLKLNLKASLHSTLRSIQPHQIAEMSSNKEAFAGIKPLHHPYYTLDSYLIQNHFQTKLHNIFAVREAIVKLELKFPNLKELVNYDMSKFTEKELASYRSITSNIVSKHIHSDLTVIQTIESLKEEDAEIIYSILLSIEHLITLEEKKQLEQFDILMNHIFDLECTRQIINESEKLKKQKAEKNDSVEEEEPEDDEIKEEEEEQEHEEIITNPYLKIEDIDSELEIAQRAIIASRLLVEISILARRRAELSSKLTHKDAASKIGEISEKKLSKLILSLKEQYESGEDLQEFMEPLTQEQLITQQLLLQSFIRQLTNDTFIATCGIDISLMNNLSNSQLVPMFFDALLREASTNPNSLRTLQNPELKTLVYLCDLTPYHVARLTLYYKMMLYIKTTITTLNLNKKYSHLNINKQTIITTNAYDEIELVPIHELLRISLSLKSSNSEIKASHLTVESDDKKQLRELVAAHNLALQLKPTQLYFSMADTNAEKAASEFGYRPFVSDLDQSLIRVISNPTSIEKKEMQKLQLLLQLLPNDTELHQRLIQMVRSVFSVAPTMLNLPTDEIRSLLLSLTRKSIGQLTEIYNADEIDYFPDQLNSLIQSGSQLASLLIAVLKLLPIKVTVRPVDLLIYISNLSINCISINEETNREEFRTNLIKFIDDLKKLEVSLVSDINADEFKNIKLDIYSSLAQSIKKRDVNLSTIDFTDFNATNEATKLIDEKETDDELIEEGSKVQKKVIRYYVNRLRIITRKAIQLKNLHELLVDRITKGTTNPYEFIRSLTELSEVRSVINECSDNLNSSLTKYITAVKSQTENDSIVAKTEFTKILNSISIAQAATLRGFEIEDKSTFSFYCDAITMFSASFANIISLADLKTEGTKSTAQIRRTVRAINRTISQLSDELAYAEIEEELLKKTKKKSKSKKKEESESSEQQSLTKSNAPMEKSKLLFIKILTRAAMFVSCTGSAYASSRVPETRATFVKGEETNYEEMLNVLKDHSTEINKLNTDRSSGEIFNIELNSLLETLNIFVDSSKKVQEITEDDDDEEEDTKEEIVESDQNEIAFVTSKLVLLNNSLSKVALSASKMTDITPLVPDILNADRLRKNFTLPPVPSDTFNLKIQDAIDPIDKMVEDYNTKINSVVEMCNGNGEGETQLFVNNSTIAQTMNEAGDNLQQCLQQILRATTVIYSVESRNELTSNASLCAQAFNKLLQMLRSKFLLRPDDWNKKNEKYTKIVSKSLEKALKEAKKAKKAGMKKEEHSMLLQRLKMTYEKLLAARGSLQVIHERIFSRSRNKNDTNNEPPLAASNREWGLRIAEIGIEQASVTLDCMIKYRENPEDVSNLDQLLSFADSLANECNNGQKQASLMLANDESSDSTENQSIAVLKGIESSSQTFIENGGEGTDDEKLLKEKLSTNILLIKSFIDSAKASIESKDGLEKLFTNTQTQKDLMNSKKKPGVLNSLSLPYNYAHIRLHRDKDDLLKKLQLETNVIEARLRLQHAENVLEKICRK